MFIKRIITCVSLEVLEEWFSSGNIVWQDVHNNVRVVIIVWLLNYPTVSLCDFEMSLTHRHG